MDFRIRPGRADDLASIAPWTTDTFEWGDYIEERFDQWLLDSDSEVLVCVGEDDVPLALAHVRMASPTEAWMEGARVHPDHKRSGMGTALNHAGVAWAGRRGARVARLAVETENTAARNQVVKLGYRAGSDWVSGFTEPEASFRAIRGARLSPSASAGVDSAWMFWSTSELAGSGREMLCEGWLWRKARPEDLKTAAAAGRLLQSPHGWVMFRQSDDLETMWLASTPEDLPGLLEGILDHSATIGADHLVVKCPALDWVIESLKRAGFRVSPLLVYYKPV